jgi:hypothetical protein
MQVKETYGGGGSRGAWLRRLSLGLLSGLLSLTLSATFVHVSAAQNGAGTGAASLLVTLETEARGGVASGVRFANDLRLLYLVSNLQPLVAKPHVEAPVPAVPTAASCKLISEKSLTLQKSAKSRS